eukprot:767793-Hanusia_phi.AAC.7
MSLAAHATWSAAEDQGHQDGGGGKTDKTLEFFWLLLNTECQSRRKLRLTSPSLLLSLKPWTVGVLCRVSHPLGVSQRKRASRA